MTTTLLAFVIVLGIVVFVHELGHFLAAKAVGIGVPRFSIGFGPPTPLRFHRGETEFVVAWIPLGGYVKMATREEEGGVSAIEGGSAAGFPPDRLFENKPLWARILVLSAGVLMNVVLAWAIYAGLAATGIRLEDPITTLAAVDTAGLPAEAQPLVDVPYGTPILRINGDTVASWNEVRAAVGNPTSDRLRFDFGDGVEPVIVRIPGTNIEARSRVALAMHNLRPARIGSIVPGSAAASADLQLGDELVRVGPDTVRFWDEMVSRIRPRPDEALDLTILRGPDTLMVTVTTGALDDRDFFTNQVQRIGFLGVGPDEQFREVEFTIPQAVVEGGRQAVDGVTIVIVTVKGLVFGRVSPKELAGPIGIGQLSGRAARAGVVPFLSLIALISINLAVFNLLPIPVLDGGHLVFLLLEGLLGRPVSTTIRLRLTQVGMALLLALVVLVMYNDVLRVLGMR
jgi:regulator of sigma E protease